MKNIEFKDLEEYRKDYLRNKNVELQNSLKNEHIEKVCLDEDVLKENKFEFNFELEDCKIYNQAGSFRCWMFSVLNLIKNNVAGNLNINKKEFALSPNYLNFYDKLEKANHVYEMIINLDTNFDTFALNDCNGNHLLADFMKNPVKETGRVEYARELIKKYGLVPMEVMPETYNSLSSSVIIKVFNQKVRCDLYKLIELRKNNASNIEEAKDEMLKEDYAILSHILGDVPTKFDYSYIDVNGNKVELKDITPYDFYKKYCTINLDDFVLIGNVPMKNKPYYKKYRKMFSGNIEDKSYIEFINLPLDVFQDLILKQLKDNMPVPFSCENKKYRNLESTVLDTRLLKYDKLLGISDLNKQEALESYDITLKHWMTFRGVHIENGKPVRWKVEDSGGEKVRNNGYYVMNQNFFEKCVFQGWIDKKYLPKEILELTEEEPIMFGFIEPV